MYRLWEELKNWGGPPSLWEVEVAANKIPSNSIDIAEHLKSLQTKPGPLQDAFQRQLCKAEESWDQTEFEKLQVEWIVACDQPFEEVERPEFKKLLNYTHHRPTELNVPSATTVKRRVMKLGEMTMDDLKKFIADLESKVSLSLDAWSSGNGFAFMGIVMHYVSNDWSLKEVLIDFRELIGEHSGVNMAAAVYQTIDILGLKGQIQSIVSDNSANNDTMMEELERLFEADGIEFNAIYARGRCLPHTVHLAALKLLEGIGALSAEDMQKCTAAYQDTVSLPLSSDANPYAGLDDVVEALEEEEAHLLNALEKLRRIIRAIRSSPQRRKRWLDEVDASRCDNAGKLEEIVKMLILDVRTRWASTHQMCGMFSLAYSF
ncbi:hypothetical protein M422DRAFT_181119 [Sphaerobolus stellatus SS14]|uniref:AC transposase n=1 Tax=Sphaerobolus stellatus (strain SS14) TaxID=990650 RepID=A0A0C9VC35_SPHS4|nr:hypothetical protein M422DRAFT_181119 [Sphaerobolus stellatus SS14]